ncbi:MAG TPA: hypothetical protein VK721_11260 [Solirubrobacteraceae bacterium]|nr:hypothetical protein [Solirubrobacteraceae bacterium]
MDKYALLPALAGATTVLDRGGEPLQKVKWLFDRRNELVHARPRDDRDLTWDPKNHNPLAAATSIVAVADAAAKLSGEVPDASFSAMCSLSAKHFWSTGSAPQTSCPKSTTRLAVRPGEVVQLVEAGDGRLVVEGAVGLRRLWKSIQPARAVVRSWLSR